MAGILATSIACDRGPAGSGVQKNSSSNPSAVLKTGEDAPLPSVVSFFVTINSIALNNGSGSVTVLSTPTTVDFGRLVGLRSLLGFQTVSPGTYGSATFNLTNPVIHYANLQRIFVGGSWNSSTVTLTLALISLRSQGVVRLLLANSVTNVSGLSGLSNAGAIPIGVGGVVLKNQTSGLPDVYVHRVIE